MRQSRIVPIELDSGQVIHAEISPTAGEKDVAGTTMRFDSLVDSITGIARQLNGAIASVAPDVAKVEFGLQLSTEAGTVMIQAPASGILAEINYDENETVAKGEVLCTIDDEETVIRDPEAEEK